MIPDDTKSGAVWCCAPGGSTEVWLVSLLPDDRAMIRGQGIGRRWARTARTVPAADLFYTHEEAQAEFRRRKREAV